MKINSYFQGVLSLIGLVMDTVIMEIIMNYVIMMAGTAVGTAGNVQTADPRFYFMKVF